MWCWDGGEKSIKIYTAENYWCESRNLLSLSARLADHQSHDFWEANSLVGKQKSYWLNHAMTFVSMEWSRSKPQLGREKTHFCFLRAIWVWAVLYHPLPNLGMHSVWVLAVISRVDTTLRSSMIFKKAGQTWKHGPLLGIRTCPTTPWGQEMHAVTMKIMLGPITSVTLDS